MPRNVIAVAALLLTGVAGLGGVASAQTDPATTTTAAQTPPKVVVTDRGAAPRTALRYSLAPGPERDSQLLLKTTITQRAGGKSRRVVTPPITLGLATQVTGPGAAGGTEVAFEFRSVKVNPRNDPDTASRIQDAIEPIVGTAIVVTLSDRGEAIASTASLPENLSPNASAIIQQVVDQARTLTVPLPDEPVGRGARWDATERVAVNGLEVTQTAHYRVQSLDGDKVRLRVSIAQHAGRQTTTDPESGTEVELLNSNATGGGNSTLSLSGPFPTASLVHLTVHQRLRAEGHRISQTLQLDIGILTA
jgi:hypothetical protein